jgi:membrane protein
LTVYVEHVARLGATHGPVGAAIGLMLWFYLTFYAVLLGAEFNAQIERVQRAAPSDAAPERRR